MNELASHQINRLIEAVLASAKYKSVSVDFIRYIGTQELTRQHNLKEAIKSTKNKLHQVGGAYQTSAPRYSLWLNELKYTKRSGNKDRLLDTCKWIMGHHSSTRERLPVLEQFYSTILANLPPISSVIDIACGLHPLAIPWMPLSEHTQYYAYDIYEDMIDFLNDCIALMPMQGFAKTSDVIRYCPTQKVDVAFILKTIPCLEQVDKAAGLRLLETINADHLVVSFPSHSLGGKSKGMATNYETRFYQQVANKPWSIQRFEFPGELVYLVSKSRSSYC
jgi:16S rRNA (guanine(1405)-N(7))-methyltransferase